MSSIDKLIDDVKVKSLFALLKAQHLAGARCCGP